MPYVASEARDRLLDLTEYNVDLHIDKIESPGELNFALTAVISSYFEFQGNNYRAINDVLGALEGAKLEFYRRVAAPYEDKKIEENGDVY